LPTNSNKAVFPLAPWRGCKKFKGLHPRSRAMKKYAIVAMTAAALTLGGIATASAAIEFEGGESAAAISTPVVSGKAQQHARAMQAHASAPAEQAGAPEAAAVTGMGVLALVLLLAL
jgi:hypothetical protein